jgi:hypothetical protein
MLRAEWVFTYRAEEVAAAAVRRRDHHRGRLDFWELAFEDADEKLRSEGVDFRDLEVTGGQRTEVVVDPQLMARVNECRVKIKMHTEKHDEYARWARALEGLPPSDRMSLHVNDIHYFDL